jgi:hypothetical protein
MNESMSLLGQVDQVCQQIANAIQSSELQIYAVLAVIAVATFFLFPPKDDFDQI